MVELEISNRYPIDLILKILNMGDTFIIDHLISYLYDIDRIHKSVEDPYAFIRAFDKEFIETSMSATIKEMRRYKKAFELVHYCWSDYDADFVFIKDVLKYLNDHNIRDLVNLVIYIRNNLDQKKLMMANVVTVIDLFKNYISYITIDTKLDLEPHYASVEKESIKQYFDGYLVDGKRVWKQFAYEYTLENGEWNFAVNIFEDYCDLIVDVKLHGLTCDLNNMKSIKQLTEELAVEIEPIRINKTTKELKEQAIKEMDKTKEKLLEVSKKLQGLKNDPQYIQVLQTVTDDFVNGYDEGCARLLKAFDSNSNNQN